jgi:HAD superfamily hydrolase (TIGR01490 family)
VAFHYSISQIDYIVRPKAIDRLCWHTEQGHKVVIVSASIECWLAPWCKKNGFELLATKLEVKNGVVTGNLLGSNCFGIEKVNRIKDKYDLSQFNYIYAYGDSKGDIQMLDLANESFYKPFK